MQVVGRVWALADHARWGGQLFSSPVDASGNCDVEVPSGPYLCLAPRAFVAVVVGADVGRNVDVVDVRCE